MTTSVLPPAEKAGPTDEEVVRRVRAGQIDLFEVLMRRYNQRIYRIARAVSGNDGEAEDLVQETWVRAYAHLDQFAGRAAFSTWLTRILLHEGWARARRSHRFEEFPSRDGDEGPKMTETVTEASPEREAFGREVQSMVEAAIDSLPEGHRTVFVMRDVEELSTAETAECLELSEEAVKTRLHRARASLRKRLLENAGAGMRGVFPFLGARCDRTVARVFRRIQEQAPEPEEQAVSPS
jgi:RNA polymerase sigma-70 factor (ECF subfamily)